MLNFPNVSLLSLNQESQFFDAGFNYSNKKTLEIQGSINDLTNSFGITGIWTGQEGILETIKRNTNFNALVLNDYNFGTGRILDFSFTNGRDVQTKEYNATIEVFETGNLFNFTGNYYSGVNTANFQFLQDFSESYSFTKTENGGYSSERSASIRFNSGLGQLNAIDSAKLLAKTLFTGNNLGFAFYSGYTSRLGKRFYTESYNLIDNSADFGESFQFDIDSGRYSATRTNQFQLGIDGIVTVVEDAVIKGIETPTFENAALYLGAELSGSYDRCNQTFSVYAPVGASPLLENPLTNGRTFDIFNNNLGYTISYSNDRANSGIYLWDYTQQVNYSEGIARLSENGSIQGKGGNKSVSFTNAKTGFAMVKSTSQTRSNQFYIDNVGSPVTNFLESQSVSYSPFKAAVEYGFEFSNEVLITGTSGIKNIRANYSDGRPIYSYGKFEIFNFKEIIQDQNNGTAGNSSLRISLQGEKGVTLLTYLANAKVVANQNIPSGVDAYINGANYSFNPAENLVEVDVNWTYNRAAVKTVSIL